MKRKVTLEQTYDYPPARVWQALTDPEALREWLMENDFQPKIGHIFRFRAKPTRGWSGILECEVLELEEARRLSYSWSGRSDKSPEKLQLRTTVTWSLEPIDGGRRTRLVLVHDGFEGLKEIAISFIMGSGWKKMLEGRILDVLARTSTEGFRASGVANACH